MKKHSIILLLLAAVLCLSMLLSSCALFKKNENNDTTPAPQDDTPTDFKPDYAAIIGKWNEFLTFTDPTVDTPLKSASSVFNGANTSYSDVIVTNLGNFYLRTEFFYNNAFAHTHEYLTAVTYTVYNNRTGAEIWEETVPYDPTVVTNESYEIFDIHAPVLVVKHNFYELSVGEIYTPAYRYSYYFADGTAILENSEVAAHDVQHNMFNNTYAVTIENKIYVFDSFGELLITFDKSKEYLLPQIDLAYGEYFYDFYENGSALIFDKSYQKIGEYLVTDDYGTLHGRYVLNNGNLLYHFSNETLVDTAEYDYETVYDEKINQHYVIVDAKTGAATVVQPDYKILSLLSANDTANTGIGFKGDYQLAVIQKINEKILSRETVTVILDNELKIVAELPNFIVDQASIEGMKDGEKLLISSMTYNDSQALYYTVNVADGTPALYVDVTDSSYRSVNNGFIYEGKLYNNACQMVFDLTPYAYEVYDHFILIKDFSSTHIVTIENGALVKKAIEEYSTNVRVQGKLIIVDDYSWSQSKIYNTAGEQLYSMSGLATVHESNDEYVWIVAGETYYIFK